MSNFKKKLSKKKLKEIGLCLIVLVGLIIGYKKYDESVIYDNLSVDFTDSVFEYGNKINLKSFFKKNNKDYKYSIVKDVNTSKVGKQQVKVQVEYKGVSKVVPLSVDVVDTTAPELSIKEESITINEGDSIVLKDNIDKASDNNEDISYKEKADLKEEDNNYYTVDSNGFDKDKPGDYTVLAVAVDKAGNKTEKSFKVKVKEVVKVVEPAPVQTPSYNQNIVQNANPNPKGNDIVSIAMSLVGSSYVYGGNSPQTGYDCSGFVQYVYSQVGKSISRSSYTQANDGVGVSLADAQPGDIMTWGHGGRVTHSSIYIGNGQIVHAMNSNTGVVVSNVNGWTNYDTLMAVRRVS